jgi:hypothetical protein
VGNTFIARILVAIVVIFLIIGLVVTSLPLPVPA